jgi:AcrR family transcriptional regulator
MARISPERRERLGEERRNQILEAALKVWIRDGFHDAPVDAIAREAGLAKGTIYLYFATKEAMLQAAIERFSLMPAIEEQVQKIAEIPPERAIPAMLALLQARLRERSPALHLLLRSGALKPENARLFMERVILPGNRLVASYLDRCVERGALRPLDTFVAARVLIGSLVMFVLSQDVLGGAELRPIADEAIVETVSELFLRGALARDTEK